MPTFSTSPLDSLRRTLSPRFAPPPTPPRALLIHGGVMLLWVLLFARAFGTGGILAWSVGLAYVFYDTALVVFVFVQTLPLARVRPVLDSLSASGLPLSIDTRRGAVMAAALDSGARLVNDVSALTHDRESLALVAARGCPVVLMHAQGTPATMQDAPAYGDVVRDVFDWLEARIEVCTAAGIDRRRIIADPGIGFGKTIAHNLALLRGVATFHALGVSLLIGVSRKKMIGTLSDNAPVGERLGGSIALALHGIAQGVQIVRVHDVAATVQAVRLWQAVG